MPDEIPENVDLGFLAKQNARILEELSEARSERGEMREQIKLIPQIAKDVSELQIALAATRTDIGVIKADVEDIKETARLIEGRLVRLEKHAGLLKA